MGKEILISGAAGFVGTPLTKLLTDRGDTVVKLTRGPGGDGSIHWDPAAGELDAAAVEGFDSVIHLAGESIAGVWTKKKKHAIVESRRAGTTLLAEALAGATDKPESLINSSAIGLYGSRGDEVLKEDSGVGEGFLAELVRVWEESAQPARDAGIRVVNLRLGLVTAQSGGMMGPMKPAFKLGVGGKLGDGEQWWSWVTLDDVVRAFAHAVDNPALAGPYNVAAPNPVTNAQFTKSLGHALHRPTFLPAPKFALKTFAGEMADEMLLTSQRIDSSKLVATGFEFSDTELDPALERLFS
ncbi:MAG: TIGR01777 family oxidoreductase [Thermoleophilaceae bacterium]|nr:TIGR01777 family oxidoreductase [Thermoleophilaceae bacterium]